MGVFWKVFGDMLGGFLLEVYKKTTLQRNHVKTFSILLKGLSIRLISYEPLCGGVWEVLGQALESLLRGCFKVLDAKFGEVSKHNFKQELKGTSLLFTCFCIDPPSFQ